MGEREGVRMLVFFIGLVDNKKNIKEHQIFGLMHYINNFKDHFCYFSLFSVTRAPE